MTLTRHSTNSDLHTDANEPVILLEYRSNWLHLAFEHDKMEPIPIIIELLGGVETVLNDCEGNVFLIVSCFKPKPKG